MIHKRKLPKREEVFLHSLQVHGFRKTKKRENLKKRRGYVILSTNREDSMGVDFWVKMPYDMRIFPMQISQRGVRFFRKHKRPSREALQDFIKKSEQRIAEKRARCKRNGITFVLVRDYGEVRTTACTAASDVRALRCAMRGMGWRT